MCPWIFEDFNCSCLLSGLVAEVHSIILWYDHEVLRSLTMVARSGLLAEEHSISHLLSDGTGS